MGYAQGTTYSLSYFAKKSLVEKSGIDSIMRVIDQSMSLYLPHSKLMQFNESLNGLEVDPHFIKVFKKALAIHEDTQGKLDVTVAPLVQAWGFGPQKADKFPDEAQVKNILPCIGMEKLKLQMNYLSKIDPCVKIDFNGIAQGYTVDVVAAYLQLKGIKHFIFELGGELRVKGKKADGTLFKIGIEGPLKQEGEESSIKHVVAFKEGGLTTSGNYQKKTHLIDPKSGYPLNNEMISVTVYANDAITADGYDNALMAMSVKEALAFVAKRKNLEVYIIYKKRNGEIADTLSTGFKKLIVN